MRLSTSTVIYFNRRDGSRIPLIDSIRRCGMLGYRVMDLDFCSGIRCDDYELKQPDWEHWIEEVVRVADKYGVSFSQSHAPFYNVCDPYFADKEYYDEMIRRSIIVSGLLGVKWVALINAAIEQSLQVGRYLLSLAKMPG
mgnify:CR=1 FL=1